MIVAVEGPSAAGKTTWCAQQGWPVVAEYTGRRQVLQVREDPAALERLLEHLPGTGDG